MNTVLVVVVAVLAVGELALAFILQGAMRRALALMTRLELSLVPTETDDGPRLGRVIGLGGSEETAVTDLVDGQNRSLVLMVEGGCEPCRVLLEDLSRHWAWRAGIRGFVITDGTSLPPLDLRGWELRPDPGKGTFEAWGVSSTPAALLVDRDGAIRASWHPNTAKGVKQVLDSTMEFLTTKAPEQEHVHN